MTPRPASDESPWFALDGRTITVGRDPGCDIIMKGVGVSRKHAQVHLDPSSPTIRDTGSSLGIRVDDKPALTARLVHGSLLTIGVLAFRVEVGNCRLRLVAVLDPVSSGAKPRPQPASATLRLGRDLSNDIVCEHPIVSRFHSTFVKIPEGAYRVIDNQSSNGTYVNGRRIRECLAADGDVVQVGPYRFFIEGGEVIRADDYSRIKVEASGLSVRRKKTSVVRDVTLSIAPGEFVVILGPSGAGKSTLTAALTGQIPFDEGQVSINGMPLRQFRSAFRSSIGFLSQHNQLHGELTVFETFREQCVLRLPADSLDAERQARIAEVLDMLDLTAVADRLVHKLSGGEAKRVHLGIELLASPALIVLDEPLAGLDPGLVRDFMELFRKISAKGCTILLTTHTLEQIDVCSRAVFVNRGRVIFQGPPAALAGAFGVATVSDVYEKVRRPDGGLSTGEGLPDSEAFVRGPRTQREPPLVRIAAHRPSSIVSQFRMLAARYFRILRRDSRNLALLFVQGPVIALLLLWVFRGDLSFLPMSFYFCVTISLIWVGGSNTAREIVKERALVGREYRAGLSVTAYVMAKLAVFGALSALQSLIFGVCLWALFSSFALTLSQVLLLLCAGLGGSIVGLAVSAAGRRTSQASAILPVVMVPQILFSGAVMPFDHMTGAGRLVSYLTVSRPVFSLFKRACVLDQSLWSVPEWVTICALCIALIIFTWTVLRSSLSQYQGGE